MHLFKKWIELLFYFELYMFAKLIKLYIKLSVIHFRFIIFGIRIHYYFISNHFIQRIAAQV